MSSKRCACFLNGAEDVKSMPLTNLRQGSYLWNVSSAKPRDKTSDNFYPGGFGTEWRMCLKRRYQDTVTLLICVITRGVCATFDFFLNEKLVLAGLVCNKNCESMVARLNSKEFYISSDLTWNDRADIEVRWNISGDVGKEMVRETLTKDLGQMLGDARYSDFAIQGKDGTRFPVHRIVLSARCPVFRAMLDTEMLEVKTGCLKIDDFPSKTVKDLIAFLYTSRLPEFDHLPFVELFKAGRKYQLMDLIEITAEQLILNLSPTTAIDLLLLADEFEEEGLKTRSLKYIAENRTLFTDAEKFDVLLELKPNLLKDIIIAMKLS